MIHGHQPLGLDIQLIQAFCSTGKLFVLIVLTYERLHHTDGGDVLLHALVQIIVFYKNLLEQACHSRDNMVERETQDDQCHNENHRQTRINYQTHHDTEQQAERSTHRNAQYLLVGILQGIDISRHARH